MRARRTPKKVPKSAIQRAREFRARQRALRSGPQKVSPLPTADQPSVDNTRERPSTSKKKPKKGHVSKPTVPYTNFVANHSAHRYFKNKFYDNPFGSACQICDRLWFQSELKILSPQHQKIIAKKFIGQDVSNLAACKGCIQALARNNIPTFAKFNGFRYPEIPTHLPQLNSVSERLISPKIPFLQVRRLLNVEGHDELLSQVINVPTTDNNMAYQLPRNLFDDYCINVRVDQKRIYESVELMDLVNKSDIQAWLEYLITTPLYETYNIKIDEAFFDDKNFDKISRASVIEKIPIAKSFISQQQTLLWNVDKYLQDAPSDVDVPYNTLFDDHAEELSFPGIYLGQYRIFKDGFRVTPFSIVSSELRRADRRGVTPQHLLYMAMKIMRIRVHDALTNTSKIVGKDWNAVRQQMLSEDYINQSLESNLAFLKCIPNSTWYWAERKRDLSTMLRQLGKPSMCLTLSANETGWIPLLQVLYKLKHGVQISEKQAIKMSLVERSTLVNGDAVTCAIYFSKLVNVLMTILQSKKGNPFDQFYVTHYFQHIEFQSNGSPQARILLWVSNDPKDLLDGDMATALELIDKVISVSARESSGFIDHQIHQHTFQCYDKEGGIGQVCKFGAPFLPCRLTTILTPLPRTDIQYAINVEHYKIIKKNLEINDYADFETFYDENGITSDDHYLDIIRAGIDRPKVLVKREPSEKWHQSFNPFILNILNANMNVEFIPDEYSCADYVVDYINKADRGISDLRRRIIAIMNANPEFNITDITKELSAEVLNTVEMTTQEAAWYLLREPTSKNSTPVLYIPTVRPAERPKVRKNHHQLVALDVDEDSPDVWKESWYDKYEKRPTELEDVTLAQFVANYTRNFNTSTYVRRRDPCLIRYHNYDMLTQSDEYKREMVTLHVPFRDEELEIIADNKFLQLYKKHETSIFTRRQEFESDINVQGTLNRFRLFQGQTIDDDKIDVPRLVPIEPESDPFAGLGEPELPENWDCKSDSSTVTSESPILMKREEPEIPGANSILFSLLTKNGSPFHIFLSGPMACPKTFIIRIMTEVYNRYKTSSDSCSVFTNYSSSNKTSVASENMMTYTTLRAPLPKMLALSVERAEQFRALLDSIQILIVEDVSTISAEVVAQIDMKLKQITGIYDVNFGGISIILVGELRKSLLIPAVSIPNLLNTLKYLELNKVMQQSNELFSVILGKISKGEILDEPELRLMESRFFTEEEVDRLCPHGIRVFGSHESVNDYNQGILDSSENKIVSVANDIYIGCPDGEQEIYIQKFLKMSIVETRGLPYEIVFVMQKLYMVTTNYDASFGLVAGALAKLVSIERDVSGEVTKVWLKLLSPPVAGGRKRKRPSGGSAKSGGDSMVPMVRRRWSVPLNEGKTIIATRDHFPLLPACAITMDITGGKTFDEMVYEYRDSHSQQLVYMTLSRVTRITGLYIVTPNNDLRFHHGRKTLSSQDPLAGATPAESFDLADDKSLLMDRVLIDFIIGRRTLSVLSFDHQTRGIISADLNAIVRQKPSILLLLETYPDDEEKFKVPDFNCEMRFKCSNGKTNSVAIHRVNYDRTNIVTGHMDVNFRQSICLIANAGEVGEICGARCLLENNKTVITVMIYVSPGQTVRRLIEFIHEVLLAYTIQGAALLKRDLDKIPMIFGGHFNMNFAASKAQPLIDFLEGKFGLKINKDPAISPTDTGTTIDALFCRHLEQLESTSYVLYSSYDRPVAS
ncbi:uncharacterized protein LOC107037017 [Diachasma alloeum]|uniref:uncharacterized protein LOC107037017 n=1 Tax=Diachasma alloeum TaxID=454923 RepID=UPI00073850D2|nr:uncharacterized protein LOC107037017 [Diachasma alloeum]